MRIIGFFIAILLSVSTFSQYTEIDQYVKTLDFKRNAQIKDMAGKLTAKSQSDKEKLRAIFIWIAHNIEYDVRSFQKGRIPDSDAASVVGKKKAVCQGYSNLFKALSKAVGVKAFVVSGYSKGYGFANRKKLQNADHAWIGVYADEKWQLIDPTWGAGHLNSRGKYVSAMQEKYFLSDPSFYITEHLPEDPAWQMLPCPLKPDEFLKDSTQILKIARKKEQCYSYVDTLNHYAALDSAQRRVNAARRMYRYFPENNYSPALLFNQAAYFYSQPLNDKSIKKEKKIEWAKRSLKYYQQADELLKKARSPREKQLRNMVRQNIANVEKFLDFYQ